MTPLQTVESIYDAFRRGDIPYILSQLAPDVRWSQPASTPWGGDYGSAAEVARFFSRIDESVETTGFEIDENIETKDQVFSYGFYSSRNRATGRESRVRFAFRWRISGGKVALYEGVLDSAPIAQAARAEAAHA